MVSQSTPLFLCVFFVAFLAFGFAWVSPEMFKVSSPQVEESWLNGTRAAQYEQDFKSAHPSLNSAKRFWGRLTYQVFGQGRPGVVVGREGWLFTAEEFEWPREANEHLSRNLSKILEVHKTLKAQNIDLVVALLPAKARVVPVQLGENLYPSHNKNLYGDIHGILARNQINVPDLRNVLKPEHFLKTDTHWNPDGAKRVAEILARNIQVSADMPFETQRFSQIIELHGDLTRYLPGTVFEGNVESVPRYETVGAAHAQDAQSLFGDTSIPITLIGTSYSADPLWHFDGFLKSALHTDVLNMANAGQGPFTVMENWLNSEEFKTTKPQIVIWEIPERYMTRGDDQVQRAGVAGAL